MTTPTIKTVTADEEEAAINVVVQAFSTDPAARWLYPDPHQYAVNFPSFVRIFGGKAFEQGSAYSIGGFSGAALWLPPGVHPDEEALAGLIQRSVSERKLEEVLWGLRADGQLPPKRAPLVFTAHRCRLSPTGQRIRLSINGARAYPVRLRSEACLSRILEPEEYKPP